MTSRPLMFYRLAEYYDVLVGEKDSRAECQRLEALAKRFGRSGGASWLDVACGTGRHLEFLRRRHHVTGVDLSPDMLRVARRRLPGVRLLLGDMRNFHLDGSFDVVSCLYSAIGHLRTQHELRSTFANFARHLKPGGLVIVEPWIDPANFHSGLTYIHLLSRRTREVTVVRMSSSSRRGARSIVRYHYLIGRAGRRIEHFEEIVPGLLVPRKRLLTLLRQAGLSPRYVRGGLTPGRGLLIGLKPVE